MALALRMAITMLAPVALAFSIGTPLINETAIYSRLRFERAAQQPKPLLVSDRELKVPWLHLE